MPQFDVFRNAHGGAFPLLLDVQADLLRRLDTRVVVPLARSKGYGKPISILNPIIRVGAVDHVAVFQELAAVHASALGELVTSASAQRVELITALDLLFSGA